MNPGRGFLIQDFQNADQLAGGQHRHAKERARLKSGDLIVLRGEPAVLRDIINQERRTGHGHAARDAFAHFNFAARHTAAFFSRRDFKKEMFLIVIEQHDGGGFAEQHLLGGLADALEQRVHIQRGTEAARQAQDSP